MTTTAVQVLAELKGIIDGYQSRLIGSDTLSGLTHPELAGLIHRVDDAMKLLSDLVGRPGPQQVGICDCCGRRTIREVVVTLPVHLTEDGIERVCPHCASGYGMVPCEGCGTWLDSETCDHDADGLALCPACADGCDTVPDDDVEGDGN